ncbi:phosphate-starvation-inducible PsiE family protein [Deinococcus sp.]|uniref:phosphate-starvation-inducible PsiE family protein n=1 Tax=Deinococcus sp. TaxID=47478 RepID=UPI0025E3799B|nr:phosphate-starvation-inducible PsiE family protein [Deinococcus sp.]
MSLPETVRTNTVGQAAEGTQRQVGSLQRIEHVLYQVAAYLLVTAAAALLVTAVIHTVTSWSEGVDQAIVRLLDRVLLALMLAEITYTLRQAERTHTLTAGPFLVIGIIAAVRRMLIVTAESVGRTDLRSSVFMGGLLELAVLACIILVFTLAARWQAPGQRISDE